MRTSALLGGQAIKKALWIKSKETSNLNIRGKNGYLLGEEGKKN